MTALRREQAKSERAIPLGLHKAELDTWRQRLPAEVLTDGWELKLWFVLTNPVDAWDWKRYEIAKHLRREVVDIPELTTKESRWAYMRERVTTLAQKAALIAAPTCKSMADLRRRVGVHVIETLAPGAIDERRELRESALRSREAQRRREPEGPGPLWSSELPRPQHDRKLLIARAIIDAQLAHPSWSIAQCQLEALARVGERPRSERIKFADLSPSTQALIRLKLAEPQISNLAASKQLGKSRSYAGKVLLDMRRRWNRQTLLKLVREAEREVTQPQNGNTRPPI